MNDPCCRTCRHWRNDGLSDSEDTDINYGPCLRHAPRIVQEQLPLLHAAECYGEPQRMTSDGNRAVWPVTQENDTCGDFETKATLSD